MSDKPAIKTVTRPTDGDWKAVDVYNGKFVVLVEGDSGRADKWIAENCSEADARFIVEAVRVFKSIPKAKPQPTRP